MNREIKFRAFNKKEKIMETVCVTPDGVGFYDHVAKDVHEYVSGIFSDPMQYTGLRDKNGVEIYEGDILLVTNDSYGVEDYISKLAFGKYDDSEGYEDHTHYGYNLAGFLLFDCIKDGSYVIGNIYENPELLEASIDE